MKKLPMILLILGPYAIIACSFTYVDDMIPVYVFGAVLALNMVYAFLLPGLGYDGKRLMFWNMTIKIFNIPIVLFAMLALVIMLMIGGKALLGESSVLFATAFFACYILQLSAGAFGISAFRCLRKQGRLSAKAEFWNTLAQLIPGVDLVNSVLVYRALCKAEKA